VKAKVTPLLYKHYIFLFSFFLALLSSSSMLSAQTIKEKKDGLSTGISELDPKSQEMLKTINQEIFEKQETLKVLYGQVALLYEQKAADESFQDLLLKINALKLEMDNLDNRWREGITKSSQEEGYGLWYQPDTTIEQLIIDYGSQDYVYMMPPEIATMKLSVASNLPVPRSAWSEMLELILANNGVGIQQVNPYLRKLYLFTTSQSAVKIVTNRKDDLELFAPNTRVCFVLSPEPADVRRIWFFLEKFVNHQSTALQLVGRDILIIGSVLEVQDLLKLYAFASTNKGDKEYKLVSLSRISAVEMGKILSAIFDQIIDHQKGSMGKNSANQGDFTDAESNGLKVITLGNVSQALFLVGTKDEIDKAEEVICEVDGQLGDVREKIIFWYTAKNSDAEDIAEVLSKIYNLMVKENVGTPEKINAANAQAVSEAAILNSPDIGAPIAEVVELKTPDRLYQESFYQDGNIAVNPAPVTLVPRPKEYTNDNRLNFIVDVKTNSIVMVVEADILPKLQELLAKLDVPKKMVQIEVLLFEKRISNSTKFGLDLLRLGSAASQTQKTSLTFNDIFPISGIANPFHKGLLSFMLSRPKENGNPAFDITYNFLLSQHDVQINASPSVITMNQTPAKFAIVEEFSINTGVFEVETVKGVTLKDAFTRAQYGITLEITPTIHLSDEEDYNDEIGDYITLETSVNFDTVQPDPLSRDRPSVTRRNIENEVLIPDGQTVILGGLRRKNINDSTDAIPFIGEIPGIGKLFSNTNMNDSSTEMFIFITPTIIADPIDDLERLRCFEMTRRPGDIPEFMCCMEEAREWEKRCLLEGSLQMLLGRPPERCYSPEGEYDGR